MGWIYDLLAKIETFITENIWVAPFFSVLLPFMEAIIPSLPLTAIIALNISVMAIAFGAVPGTILAIVLSTLGSFLGMFLIFTIIRETLSAKFVKKVNESEHGKWFIDIVASGNTGLMLMILSNPLLPSSILNYAISLTNIKVKKYIFLTLTSRIIIILFLVFLGSIFDIQNNPLNILWVMLVYSAIIIIYGMIIRYRKKRRTQTEQQ
ncbi:MAG: VTT domain-containing protein [Bacilli bacterium]|nr:VTT domain-containing protein [Bacilli bacterium]MBN2877075.1 VTT domain-containing protein [Bacilli bacterium]